MARIRQADLKDFLEEKYILYNKILFIESDPISIPHRYSRKEDIEIAGFLAATIAWGQRPTILKNATELLRRMDDAPYEFVRSYTQKDLLKFQSFVHRTFNGDDLVFFIRALRHIYAQHTSPENIIAGDLPSTNLKEGIIRWRNIFFSKEHLVRTEKHFSNPASGSAAKKINMYLRWMIRRDRYGVDFGIWKSISPALLTCPLDVHSGRVARKLGLLRRKQNDWTAAEELTQQLRKFDAKDPVKYDFALFGLGVFEKF